MSGESVEEQLYRTRKRLRLEMRRALSCVSAGAKRRLAAEWREKYSQMVYEELIRCAKNREVAQGIANWDIDKFDESRKK